MGSEMCIRDRDKDHVFLKLDHLGADVLNAKLPGICELSRTFAAVDPVYEPIPVVPTCLLPKTFVVGSYSE